MKKPRNGAFFICYEYLFIKFIIMAKKAGEVSKASVSVKKKRKGIHSKKKSSKSKNAKNYSKRYGGQGR